MLPHRGLVQAQERNHWDRCQTAGCGREGGRLAANDETPVERFREGGQNQGKNREGSGKREAVEAPNQGTRCPGVFGQSNGGKHMQNQNVGG